MTVKPIYKTPAGEQAVMALYDSALERWAVPYETRMIPTRHGETFVIICGDEAAPPLVLLHGAGSNSAIWAADVAVYGPHFRVYALDLPGEPGKSAPNRPPWDSPAYAEWLEDSLDALGIGTATLAGISQGAWTALKFAVANPQRVDKLVLMTPGGVVPDRLSFGLRAVAYSLLGQWGLRRLIRLTFGGQPIPDGVEDIMTIIMSHFKPRFGVLPLFSDAELQRLTMPTFLLGGEQDALRDLDQIAARLETLLPDLSVTILPEAGHALLDTPGHVLAFLAEGEKVR
jgi:pimeloyl-ACP methyl ester carboxylesterase